MCLSLEEFRRAITDRQCQLSDDPPGFESTVWVKATGVSIPAAIVADPKVAAGQIDYLRWLEEINEELDHGIDRLVEAMKEEIE